MGGLFLAAGALALLLAAPVLGWGLAWLVIVLAAVNLFLGFCAGVLFYYWLARWHVLCSGLPQNLRTASRLLQPEAARYWGVLSVPTVFVLDPEGRPRHVH